MIAMVTMIVDDVLEIFAKRKRKNRGTQIGRIKLVNKLRSTVSFSKVSWQKLGTGWHSRLVNSQTKLVRKVGEQSQI